MSAAVLAPDTVALIHALYAATAKAAETADIIAQLRAAIIDRLGDAEAGVTPDGEILVTQPPGPRRFNPDTAQGFLSAAQVDACSPPTFSPALAKKLLTGEQLDAAMSPSSTRRFVLA